MKIYVAIENEFYPEDGYEVLGAFKTVELAKEHIHKRCHKKLDWEFTIYDEYVCNDNYVILCLDLHE